MTRTPVWALALSMMVPATAASAEDHQVLMLNRDSEGRAMQFAPAYLEVAPGDTVTFVAKDKGHNSESLKDKIPEAAEPWKSRINQEITITLDVEGYYAYKCTPHLALGMVGLIRVGDVDGPPDEALADGIPGKGKARMLELIEEAGEPEDDQGS